MVYQMLDLNGITRVHMVGIGGVSMSALAHALHDRGAQVVGSDIVETERVQKLRALGITVHIGHDKANLDAPELIVHTTAIKPENPELAAGNAQSIPIIHRSELLAWFLEGKRGMAIAGTHGKTTTTAMVGTILLDAGVDPTVFLGGTSFDFHDNYHLGTSDIVVFEADESDASFCQYLDCSQIITNVEPDHLDHHHDFETLKQVFADFAKKGDPDGFLIYGSDCPDLVALAAHCPGAARSFALDDPDAFYRATDIATHNGWTTATVLIDGRPAGMLRLSLPGRHNVANALAALGMVHTFGLPVEKSLASLAKFSGTSRRFELLYHQGKLRIYDDYAHHPTEIRAALAGARDAFGDVHITAIFQPHRPSRTKFLFDDFARAFSQADAVIINSIYLAREEPIPDFSAELLADRIRQVEPYKPVHYFESQDDLLAFVHDRIDAEELIMVMGAGDITEVGRTLASRLADERE